MHAFLCGLFLLRDTFFLMRTFLGTVSLTVLHQPKVANGGELAILAQGGELAIEIQRGYAYAMTLPLVRRLRRTRWW